MAPWRNKTRPPDDLSHASARQCPNCMLGCMQTEATTSPVVGLNERQSGTGVAYAAEAIRQLIAAGVAAPGQQLRQEQLATDLGISRAPIREALQALLAEGVVEHSPNVGYSVVRFSVEALEQIYRMRTLLESELYAASVPIGPTMAEGAQRAERAHGPRRRDGRAAGTDGPQP